MLMYTIQTIIGGGLCHEGPGSSWRQDAKKDEPWLVINCADKNWEWHHHCLRFMLNLRFHGKQNQVQM
jgi:hypothetical protein